MPRWTPLGLIVLGLVLFAVLCLPLVEPGLFWLFVVNPDLAPVADTAALVAGTLVVWGVSWLAVRWRRTALKGSAKPGRLR